MRNKTQSRSSRKSHHFTPHARLKPGQSPRALRLETLENRQMLSVSPNFLPDLEPSFSYIPAKYYFASEMVGGFTVEDIQSPIAPEDYSVTLQDVPAEEQDSSTNGSHLFDLVEEPETANRYQIVIRGSNDLRGLNGHYISTRVFIDDLRNGAGIDSETLYGGFVANNYNEDSGEPTIAPNARPTDIIFVLNEEELLFENEDNWAIEARQYEDGLKVADVYVEDDGFGYLNTRLLNRGFKARHFELLAANDGNPYHFELRVKAGEDLTEYANIERPLRVKVGVDDLDTERPNDLAEHFDMHVKSAGDFAAKIELALNTDVNTPLIFDDEGNWALRTYDYRNDQTGYSLKVADVHVTTGGLDEFTVYRINRTNKLFDLVEVGDRHFELVLKPRNFENWKWKRTPTIRLGINNFDRETANESFAWTLQIWSERRFEEQNGTAVVDRTGDVIIV